MNLSETFDQPIILTIGEKEKIEFPRLRIRDYLNWVDELTEKRRDQARKSIPPTMQGEIRQKTLQRIETDEATLDDLVGLIFTPFGVDRVLKMSLGRNGVTESDAEKIVDRIPANDAMKLAMSVSSLLEAKKDETDKSQSDNGKPGNASPLAQSPPTGSLT